MTLNAANALTIAATMTNAANDADDADQQSSISELIAMHGRERLFVHPLSGRSDSFTFWAAPLLMAAFLLRPFTPCLPHHVALPQ